MLQVAANAAKPFAMHLQAATMKAPGKRGDQGAEVFFCVCVSYMADATKHAPSGIKAPKIRDSVQVAKERLGKSQSRSLSCYLALYNSCQFLCWYAVCTASYIVHVSSRMRYCLQVLHSVGIVVGSPP